MGGADYPCIVYCLPKAETIKKEVVATPPPAILLWICWPAIAAVIIYNSYNLHFVFGYEDFFKKSVVAILQAEEMTQLHILLSRGSKGVVQGLYILT